MSVIITLVASILCKQFSHFGQRLTRLACLPVSSIALMAFIISVRVPRTRDQSPRELRERAALSTSNYSRSERHKVNGEIPFDCIFHFYLESRLYQTSLAGSTGFAIFCWLCCLAARWLFVCLGQRQKEQNFCCMLWIYI